MTKLQSFAVNQIEPERIGFDFDDVIANTYATFLKIACEEYGYCGIALEQITQYIVGECLDIDLSVVETIFHDLLYNPLGAGLQPVQGCCEVLEELSKDSPITIITARTVAEPVERWFEKHTPKNVYQHIRIIAAGDHGNKSGYIKQAGLSHFIDDRGETCAQLAEEGVNSILFRQPWNSSFEGLPSVRSWQDIRNLCCSYQDEPKEDK